MKWTTKDELLYIRRTIGASQSPWKGESEIDHQIRMLKGYLEGLKVRSVWRLTSAGGSVLLEIDRDTVTMAAETRLTNLLRVKAAAA